MVDVFEGGTYLTRGGEIITLYRDDKGGNIRGKSSRGDIWNYKIGGSGRVLISEDHEDDLIELTSAPAVWHWPKNPSKPVTNNPRLLAARRRLCQSRAS